MITRRERGVERSSSTVPRSMTEEQSRLVRVNCAPPTIRCPRSAHTYTCIHTHHHHFMWTAVILDLLTCVASTVCNLCSLWTHFSVAGTCNAWKRRIPIRSELSLTRVNMTRVCIIRWHITKSYRYLTFRKSKLDEHGKIYTLHLVLYEKNPIMNCTVLIWQIQFQHLM